MSEHETGQVPTSAAEVYEAFFVPALFGDWPPRVVQAAGVQPGDRVLDVGFGTGILAREAERVAGANGSVTGVDINDGMLAVAAKRAPGITWKNGPAESLPFDDDAFDRVLSQFGLMFFQDRTKAIAEMLRVTRPGGSATVAVWASLDVTPGYAAIVELLRELFGPDVAKSLEAPNVLGDTNELKALFAAAGAANATVRTLPGKARFASIDAWMYTDVKGWTLADTIDDDGFERLKREAHTRLSRFVLPDGSVAFDAPAHIVTFTA